MTLSILGLSCFDPADSPSLFALFLFLISSAAGCVYVAGIAYELEGIDESEYRLGSAWVLTGFRFGLLIAGAGALYLSSFYGWSSMLRCLAAVLASAGVVVGFLPEPYKSREVLAAKRRDLLNYSSKSRAFFSEVLYQPFKNYFANAHAGKILLFILLFKIGEELLREMAGLFYLSLGFDTIDLANATKVWGMGATIAGAFIAALYLKNKNDILSLAALHLVQSTTLICFIILSLVGKSYVCLYGGIAIENLCVGMAMTAFIAFLWKTCDKRFAATQYTLLWSVYLFKGKFIIFLGGVIAQQCSWTTFFVLASVIGIAAAVSTMAIAKRIAVAPAEKLQPV